MENDKVFQNREWKYLKMIYYFLVNSIEMSKNIKDIALFYFTEIHHLIHKSFTK